MSERLPWGKFVWAHWENDEALALVSMGAQGFWMRLLCIAVKESGYVLIGGKAPTTDKLARIVRATVADVESWLAELDEEGVFSRDGRGVIYCRRMVREAKTARRNRENGAKGGNPNLRKDEGKAEWDNPPQQPSAQPPAPDPVKAEKEESREDSSDPNGSGDPPLDELSELRSLPEATGAWRLGLKVLMERGGLNETKARTFLGKLKQNGLDAAGLWRIAEAAWDAGTGDPLPYFAKAAEGAIADASTTSILNPSEVRQRAWMAEWRESPNSWRPERGPRPGEPGCRVSPAILAEFHERSAA